MKRTLGGDRLGSGRKMQVEMHNFGRSTHNLDYIWRSTMSAGTLVPFMNEIILPGESFDINLRCEIMTHPTVGPLFGSYKVQLDTFLVPIRLYNSWLHNNRLNIGLNMSQVKLPVLELTAQVANETLPDIDNSQINPSALLSYLGIRGVGNKNDGVGVITREFNAIPTLAYFEIYKNYYANKQEEIGACLHTPAVTLIETVDDVVIDGVTLDEYPGSNLATLIPGSPIHLYFTGTQPDPTQIMIYTTVHGLLSAQDLCGGFSLVAPGDLKGTFNSTRWGTTDANYWRYRDVTDINNGKPAVVTFPLENIDKMRDIILQTAGNTALIANDPGVPLEPYTWIDEIVGDIPSALSSQELLCLKTYNSDMLNNWLSTEWLDGVGGINEITSISTVGDKFEINALLIGRKVYDVLNRIAVSGGSYNDWLDANWTEDRRHQIESPMYMGGLIKELVFQEVISNSQSEEQPLGTLAGRGVLSNKHKGGKVIIKADEPCYIIGIVSLTPRVDYSQGNKWHTTAIMTMDDLHKPGMDEIGFQESINEQRAWWDTKWVEATSAWKQTSAGKVPAWLNYMTNINETRGNFAIPDNEMFMTLNRRYEMETGAIKDLTTYIDPSKFNFIFAETSLDSQNFWTQIGVDITARRKMSAKLMPNL